MPALSAGVHDGDSVPLPQPGAGQAGGTWAAPAPGIGHLPGHEDGLRSGWDISQVHLGGAHGQAGQGCGEVGRGREGWWYPQDPGKFVFWVLMPQHSTQVSGFSSFLHLSRERKGTEAHPSGHGWAPMQHRGQVCVTAGS